MKGALSLVTPPAVEPVSLVELKAHCKVEISDEDAYIEQLLISVKEQVEELCSIRCINQTWKLILNAFPTSRAITIPLAPLVSISSVKYTDENGTTATMPATDYIVDTVNLPGCIVLKNNSAWPSVTLQAANGVEIEFVCGYGAAAINVPARLKQALKFLVGHWYANREAVNTRDISAELPMTAKWLIDPFRMWQR